MARSFVASSVQYLSCSSAAVTTYPWTISAWFSTTNPTIGADQNVFLAGQSNVANNNSFGMGVLNTSGKVQYFAFDSSGTLSSVVAGSALTANTLYFTAFVGVSATNRTGYLLQGGSVTSVNDTTNIVQAAGVNQTQIGRFWVGGGTFSPFDGIIAECAAWNIDLTAAEIAILSKGYSPLFVRPQNATGYWPIIGRTSPEVELINNNTATVTGATAANHIRIIRPRPAQPRRLITAIPSSLRAQIWM